MFRSQSAVGWIVPSSVLAIWETGVRLGLVPSNWLPAPSTIAGVLIDLGATGVLFEHIGTTTARVLFGFLLGALGGTLAGVLTGRSAALRALFDPTLQALRTIPSLAWVPLFLLWLGIQETSKIALIAVGAFFPVYLNLMSGIRSIDPRLLEVAMLHGYHGVLLARRVLLPAALPAYITGLRAGLGLGWMFVVAAELMGASRGLGYLMVDGQTSSRAELVMAAILSFALLGKGTDLALEKLAARFQLGRPA